MILFPEFHRRYGPWAAIAGASEGIGRAYAHVLAERGLNLVTLARRLEVLEKDAQLIRRRHRVQVRPVSVDLADPELAARFDAAVAGLDVGLLIYNACHSRIAEFAATGLDDHMRMLDVNCRGPVALAQRLAPRLIERGRGGILLMSSMSGFQGSALVGTYAATKAFNTVLAESLWAELRPHGVDALACVAGATATPGFESATPESRRPKAFPMRPEAVAREGLDALGRKPVHIAGRLNRFVNAFARLMSRRQRTVFFSNATRGIYGPSGA
ncbi:MAG: SDR family NAD(P)-dependent oxidoreductase [Gammaproteobacteria bacterium]|nr:SDR family NAD(P)-dependent oxidoreductase [Gammaproteobacteria bacterium]